MSGKPQRLIALLAVLQVRRVTTAEALAAKFGVSARTILRDIQALIDADIPVLTERGKYGGSACCLGARASPSELTASEADVIRAVGLDLGRAARLGAETAARSAAGKLTAKRRAPLRGDPPLALSDVLTVDNRGWFAADESPDVASLARDLRLARRLRIRYRHSGAAESQVYVVDTLRAAAAGRPVVPDRRQRVPPANVRAHPPGALGTTRRDTPSPRRRDPRGNRRRARPLPRIPARDHRHRAAQTHDPASTSPAGSWLPAPGGRPRQPDARVRITVATTNLTRSGNSSFSDHIEVLRPKRPAGSSMTLRGQSPAAHG